MGLCCPLEAGQGVAFAYRLNIPTFCPSFEGGRDADWGRCHGSGGVSIRLISLPSILPSNWLSDIGLSVDVAEDCFAIASRILRDGTQPLLLVVVETPADVCESLNFPLVQAVVDHGDRQVPGSADLVTRPGSEESTQRERCVRALRDVAEDFFLHGPVGSTVTSGVE